VAEAAPPLVVGRVVPFVAGCLEAGNTFSDMFPRERERDRGREGVYIYILLLKTKSIVLYCLAYLVVHLII